MPVTPKAGPAGRDPVTPPPLQVSAALVGLEALALLVLAVLEMANLRSIRLTMGVTTTVFFLAAAAGLAWAAWSLWRARRWARGPVVMTQLILPSDANNLNSAFGGNYCDGGTGGTGIFRLDTAPGCWTGYQPIFQLKAA